jgi:hypothetical protein
MAVCCAAKKNFSILLSTGKGYTGTPGDATFTVDLSAFITNVDTVKRWRVFTTFRSFGDADFVAGDIYVLAVNVGTIPRMQESSKYSNVVAILKPGSNNAQEATYTDNPPFYVTSLVDAPSINVKILQSDFATPMNTHSGYMLILSFEEL